MADLKPGFDHIKRTGHVEPNKAVHPVSQSGPTPDDVPMVASGDLQRRLYEGEKSAGWDPADANSLSEEIAHLHEEISEAFRWWRKHKDAAPHLTCERCGRTVAGDVDLDTIRHSGTLRHYTSRGEDNTIDHGGMGCHGRFKPSGVPSELADAAIGMFYIAERFGFDLLDAIETKHQYNLTRSYAAEGRRLHEVVNSPGKSNPTTDGGEGRE